MSPPGLRERKRKRRRSRSILFTKRENEIDRIYRRKVARPTKDASASSTDAAEEFH